MADQNLVDAFNDCIDLLAQGRNVEECLQRYPQHSAELLPLIEAGLLVKKAQTDGLEMAVAKDRVRFRLQSGKYRRRNFYSALLARVAVGIVLVFLLAGGVVGYHAMHIARSTSPAPAAMPSASPTKTATQTPSATVTNTPKPRLTATRRLRPTATATPLPATQTPLPPLVNSSQTSATGNGSDSNSSGTGSSASGSDGSTASDDQSKPPPKPSGHESD